MQRIRSFCLALILGSAVAAFPVAGTSFGLDLATAEAQPKPPPAAVAKSAGAKSSKSAAASKASKGAKAKSGTAAKQSATKSKAIAPKAAGAKAASKAKLPAGKQAAGIKVPPKAAKALNNSARNAKSALPKTIAPRAGTAPKATRGTLKAVPKATLPKGKQAVGRVPPKAVRELSANVRQAKAKLPPQKTSKAAELARMSGKLRDAAKTKGNSGIGRATRSQADALGKAWVGKGYTRGKNGTLLSKDKLRQYRPPTYKGRLGVTQANFERKLPNQLYRDKWFSNSHLTITD